ncbi:hypothetical protein AVEN_208903-1 [Araneus ventricosus]|uniref:MARVEL domain-containing protein n=1 Tax=Araneus ventricosus TaxID=182803 RepID=A0A4Y2F3V1_ARAVE|nr:hypothetical protein AVEN_208903-1 [Araneus ventricosus]
MSIPTKIVHGLQVACCLCILVLLIHAGERGSDYFAGSPAVTFLLLITASHLLFSICLLVSEVTSHSCTDIYETPLIYLKVPLFFSLLVVAGTVAILEARKLESREEKEIGVAGGIAVFAALSSVFGFYTNVRGCRNVKLFSPVER